MSLLQRPVLLNAGQGYYVNLSKVFAITHMKAASVRRIYKEARDKGLLLDFTGPLKTKSLIIMDNGVIIKSCLRPADVQRNAVVAQQELDNPL